jgi:hypothetical protein
MTDSVGLLRKTETSSETEKPQSGAGGANNITFPPNKLDKASEFPPFD